MFFEDVIKPFIIVVSIIVMIVVGVLAAPTIWDKVTEDKPIYPHSGFSPECPTWKEPADDLPSRHGK